jgi:hypothetical protein
MGGSSRTAATPERGPVAVRARELWRALPGDVLGRGILALSGTRASRVLDVDGVGRVVLAEDPRLARWLDAVPRAPTAMTFGHLVVAREHLSDGLVRHEAEHVRQWTRLGPLFLPAYLTAGAIAGLRGADSYAGNRFERAACGAAELPTAIRAVAGYDSRR